MATTAKDTNEYRMVNPDTAIEGIGGCGRYQVRMTVIVHLIKTAFCFSSSNLLISTMTPTWWCVDDRNQTENASTYNTNEMFCRTRNDRNCTSVLYDDSLSTLVSEFDLICDMDYIPSTISSLNLAGQLAGSLIVGQLADLIGRKGPFFASVILLLVLHVIGFFSVSWKMFAVSTFFNGLALGFFLTIHYNLLSEFSLARWRVWIVGFPSWPIQQCLFALFAWLLHNWRYLQLMTAVLAVPCLIATWCFVPESFRWFIAHQKLEKATKIINSVAKYNKHETVNVENALQSHESTINITSQKYTFIHLFGSKTLVKITLVSMMNWFEIGIVGHGLYFGIQKLSGNLYLNSFLFSLFAIPSKGVALWSQNKIGRRYTAVLCFAFVAATGFTIGILQTFDAPHKGIVTNVLSITANAGVVAAWSSVQTMTVELYPTVIRNLGFGTAATIGGFASVLGPQLVYLETYFSGLLYYVCGAVAIPCVFSTLSLPETKDNNLQDIIIEKSKEKFDNTTVIDEDK